MSSEWMILLFDGKLLADMLNDQNRDINHSVFVEWSSRVERFVASNPLSQQQQKVLLNLVDEVERLAGARAGFIHKHHEELIKMHQVSRKYIQSSQ